MDSLALAEEDGSHAGYSTVVLCLDIGGIVFFSLTTLVSARAFAGSRSCKATAHALAPPTNRGLRVRRYFVAGLCSANLLRCVSLVMQSLYWYGSLVDLEPALLMWLEDLIWFLPSFVFISAFALVVIFLAQVQSTMTMVPLSSMSYAFIGCNVALYIVVAAVAVGTWASHVLQALRVCMLSILGVTNLAVAGALAYFGSSVWWGLSEDDLRARKKNLPAMHLTPRVLILSVACPLALAARGLAQLLWQLPRYKTAEPFDDLATCFVGEWLPSVFVLITLNSLQRSRHATPSNIKSPTESLDDSTDSEAPLLQEEVQVPPLSLCGTQEGVAWKQLYPQLPGSTASPK